MHIKNTKGVVSQVGPLGFMFLKANAKHGYGTLQKKKNQTFLPEPTHLAILSRDGILLLYHLNLRWPVTCFGQQKVEETE